MSKQVVFDFFVVTNEGRRGVERLDEFSSEDARGKGRRHKLSLSEWLRFYSPLQSSVSTGAYAEHEWPVMMVGAPGNEEGVI